MYRVEQLDINGHDMPMLVFEPAGTGPHPGLIVAQHLPVAHAGLGRDPFQLQVGERYAAAGYKVAMPFLFHWWPPETDIAVKREQFRDDWTVADLQVTFDWLAACDDVDADAIGLLGHCWGGRIAWLGACSLPPLRAAALFYGGRVKTEFADAAPAPVTLAHQIKCPVLGIFGNEDASPSPADVDDYETALREAGVAYEFHRFDGAGHGFQDFTNPDRYRETQSEQAWTIALEFLERSLKPHSRERQQ